MFRQAEQATNAFLVDYDVDPLEEQAKSVLELFDAVQKEKEMANELRNTKAQLGIVQGQLRDAQVQSAVCESNLHAEISKLRSQISGLEYENNNLKGLLESHEEENSALKALLAAAEKKIEHTQNMARRYIQGNVKKTSGKTVALMERQRDAEDDGYASSSESEESEDEKESAAVVPIGKSPKSPAPINRLSMPDPLPDVEQQAPSIFSEIVENVDGVFDYEEMAAPVVVPVAEAVAKEEPMSVSSLLDGYDHAKIIARVKFVEAAKEEIGALCRAGIRSSGTSLPEYLVIPAGRNGLPEFEVMKDIDSKLLKKMEKHKIPVTSSLEMARARRNFNGGRFAVRAWLYQADPDLDFENSFCEIKKADVFDEVVLAQGSIVAPTPALKKRVVIDISSSEEEDDGIPVDVVAMDEPVTKRAPPRLPVDDGNNNVIDLLVGVEHKVHLVNVRFMDLKDEFFAEWKPLFAKAGAKESKSLSRDSSLIVVPVDSDGNPMFETVFEFAETMMMACDKAKKSQKTIRVTSVVELARALGAFDSSMETKFSRQLEARFTSTVRTWSWEPTLFSEPRDFADGDDETKTYWINLPSLSGQCQYESGRTLRNKAQLIAFLRGQFKANN